MTEVGVIPEDWEVKQLGSFAKIGSGGTPSRTNPDYWNGDIPWITTSEVDSNYITEATEYISRLGLENSAARVVNKGTLLMAMYGQGKTRGKVAILGFDASTNQACATIEINKNNNHEFVFYNLSGRYNEIRTLSNTGNQENLNGQLIREIQVSLPIRESEQTAIATVLSDTNALISALEKLITKKRMIKQGTMQELLKPKGNWKVKTLGDIAEIKTGKKNNDDKIEEGLFPFFVRSQNVERINSYSFDGEAILIPGEGNIGGIYHYINGKFDYHQRVYKISNFPTDISGRFVYYSMIMTFNDHAMKNSVKATVDSLRLPTFQEFEIYFPPSISEQKEIVNSLVDIEGEIALLDKKLEKYKMIKQGLMQVLLTGKIRLI